MDRKNWQKIFVHSHDKIFSAIEKINYEALGIVLVVDQNKKLLGVVTDGDIRRHLLKHGSLDAPVSLIMNDNPKVALPHESKNQLLSKMQQFNILHLPIVNTENQVISLETLHHLTATQKRDNWVVIMAGGLGSRLHPLTLDTPKPLLKIGGKPILEILLENLVRSGFHQFYFSVNYKAHMIQDYFGCGEKWGVTIRYLFEQEVLGTAGSLRLLPEKPSEPFFVVNADIMTDLDFSKMLEFHAHHPQNPIATLCVRQYQNMIPYGVAHIDELHHCLLYIEEKPINLYFVSAGIYILQPATLDFFAHDAKHIDMPNLLHTFVSQKKCVATFPIQEYWLDVGSHDNLFRAASDYKNICPTQEVF